ncbi:MAG: 3-deoxy-7-phosphoheptulonate synthase [Planctomycetes bacterium]|nr:3-deoxy-7-phosphoheptulonate synthase [Planctomycetota bacterium]
MLILLHLDAGPDERARVRDTLTALDVAVEEVQLGDRTGFVVVGGERSHPKDSLARIPGVAKVVTLTDRATLVHATWKEAGHAVSLGPARFGGGHVSVIAGPCTVEDPDALREVAHVVRDAGAAALRGGVFKVRTSPYAYQGGGQKALAALHATSREVGLPFFTELTDPRQVQEVGDLIDGVQIGARHMQNFPLIEEAARLGKPMLIKRHWAADVDEWLNAAEYALRCGNDKVILCERGCKTADKHVRYLLDVGVVPYLKQRVGLPVIVDPSHAAGDHTLVPALARAAIAAGADGLIVEVHHRPETTRCDARQALSPDDFARLVRDVRAIASLTDRVLAGPSTPLRNSAVGG